MSTPQPRQSSISPNDMAFDRSYILPLNYGYLSSPWMPAPATQGHQPYRLHRSTPENIPPFYGAQYSWHREQVHNSGMLASAHGTYTQIPHDLGSWNSFDVLQPVGEVESTQRLPAAVNKTQSNYAMLASRPTYEPGPDLTYWDSHMVSGPPTSPHRQPLSPLVHHKISTPHHSLNQPSGNPSYTCSLHKMHFSYPCPEPSVPHLSAPCLTFGPTSHHISPHPTSTGFLETNPRSHLTFYRAPHREPAGSFRHRRAARAIEYCGLWIDEEELLSGLTDPDGKLAVHQCRWEEDHSPCHLWVRGDESSIKIHVQRWHGGKPGGDKSRVDCRWSTCGKTMRKDSVARHIVSVHLGETWACQGCGKMIVRRDAYKQHAVRSEFDACRTSGALITYTAGVQEIDARTALESGGRMRYASV